MARIAIAALMNWGRAPMMVNNFTGYPLPGIVFRQAHIFYAEGNEGHEEKKHLLLSVPSVKWHLR